jgi:hypothetical protein
MKTNIVREFTEQAVVARIQSRAGIRYQSAQLAAYFGVPTARMTEVLTKLCALKRIRVVRSSCSPTLYYLPTEYELQVEARVAATYHQSPVTIIKGESANQKVRRELGFELTEKEHG